ncbi:MAG: lipid-A-disaccharide synthase [Culturomica sp.]|jgi:lipid-A-disaccharide synthase|nr:lipid-A-disaccharide synthase [Culturomica sp.]
MRYYMIAGEASGDLHASNLIKGLRQYDPQADIRGWGGDLMQSAGADIVRHYKDTAVMGFFTVLKNLGRIKENIRQCCADIQAWQPDVVLLVDYGGFNLKIARYAKEHGFRVFYYISPKIWAWNTGRVETIRKYVDRMYVIFPFEQEFYSRYGYRADYAGNPLTDAICNRPFQDESVEEFVRTNKLSGKPLIALVAGSRAQELKNMLPKMLSVRADFPEYEFVIAGAPSMSEADYAPYVRGTDVRILYGQTYRLIRHSAAALVTSGTATLETALLKTPQVVCYSGEGGLFYYLMFKWFVKVKYISLVNLILDKEAITELLMQKLNRKRLAKELSAILQDPARRKQMLADYDEVEKRLGAPGASGRFAEMMVKALHSIS